LSYWVGDIVGWLDAGARDNVNALDGWTTTYQFEDSLWAPKPDGTSADPGTPARQDVFEGTIICFDSLLPPGTIQTRESYRSWWQATKEMSKPPKPAFIDWNTAVANNFARMAEYYEKDGWRRIDASLAARAVPPIPEAFTGKSSGSAHPFTGKILTVNDKGYGEWKDAPAGGGGGTVPDGTMVFKGAYMPLGYAANDVVTSGGDLFIARHTIPAGAGAPTHGADWAKLAGAAAAPALALDALTDVDAAAPTDKQALLWDDAGKKWIAGTVATTPPDLTPYAPLAGAVFTGNVTAPGHAPDAGASVRNTFFLTAPPPDTLGADGDMAVVTS
jgi:hypothetical protein